METLRDVKMRKSSCKPPWAAIVSVQLDETKPVLQMTESQRLTMGYKWVAVNIDEVVERDQCCRVRVARQVT